MLGDACGAAQLQNLRYIDLNDAINDVTTICRQLDTEASSATYAPAMVGASMIAVDDTTRTCLVRDRGQQRTPAAFFDPYASKSVFDRIAARQASGRPRRRAWLDRATKQIALARGLLKQQIASVCPEATFASVYNRYLDTYLTGIAQRADCVAGAVYVQNAVTCPDGGVRQRHP